MAVCQDLTMKYLLEVTFYAETNSYADTDRGLFLIETEVAKSELEFRLIFEAVNNNLNDTEETSTTISYCYEINGCNLDTLMHGVEKYMNCKVEEIRPGFGAFAVDNYFKITQWQ